MGREHMASRDFLPLSFFLSRVFFFILAIFTGKEALLSMVPASLVLLSLQLDLFSLSLSLPFFLSLTKTISLSSISLFVQVTATYMIEQLWPPSLHTRRR